MTLHGESTKQNGGMTLRCCFLLTVQLQKCLLSIPSFPAAGETLWYMEICVNAHRHMHICVLGSQFCF